MKLKKLIIPFVLYVLFVLFHKSITVNTLNIGSSWTFSFIAPYLLTLIAVFLFAFQFNTVFQQKLKAITKVISIIVFMAFGGIAFGVNPIYEGDFSNNYDELVITGTKEVVPKGLTMLALPGCPHCFSRIGTLNRMQKRNPELKIQVIFQINAESIIAEYENKLLSDIPVLVYENDKMLNQLGISNYPAFVYSNNEGILFKWRNDDFGNPALDFIEAKQ